MHLDVTPTVRLIGREEKTGLIFHSKPRIREPKLSLFANPYGFAQWFIAQTPPDEDFGTYFEKRSLDYDAHGSREGGCRSGARSVPGLPEVARSDRAATDQALAEPRL